MRPWLSQRGIEVPEMIQNANIDGLVQERRNSIINRNPLSFLH